MIPSKRHTLAIVATAVLAAMIAYLTLTPPQPQLSKGFFSDKAYHFIAFAALVFPSALLYQRSLIWLIPAALLFGAGIELIQPYVGRSAEMADFVADVFGIACGIALGLLIRVWLFKSWNVQRSKGQRAKAAR